MSIIFVFGSYIIEPALLLYLEGVHVDVHPRIRAVTGGRFPFQKVHSAVHAKTRAVAGFNLLQLHKMKLFQF